MITFLLMLAIPVAIYLFLGWAFFTVLGIVGLIHMGKRTKSRSQ
jgi:hypothetical protein